MPRLWHALAELLGLTLAVGVALLAYIMVLTSGHLILWLLLLGCVALLLVAAALRRPWMRAGLPYRTLFDLALVAPPPSIHEYASSARLATSAKSHNTWRELLDHPTRQRAPACQSSRA